LNSKSVEITRQSKLAGLRYWPASPAIGAKLGIVADIIANKAALVTMAKSNE
jgi:hypothetical protein